MDRGDAESFVSEFRSRIHTFRTLLIKHVYPPFADPAAFAREEALRLSDEALSQSGLNPADVDPADYAEDVEHHTHQVYAVVSPMQYVLVNLFAAGLFHLFEQQVASVLSHAKFNPPKAKGRRNTPLANFRLWIEASGVAAEKFPAWNEVEELNLVANVVKHAVGRSAVDLRERRSDYFDLLDPSTEVAPLLNMPMTYQLTGTDFYVKIDDFEQYVRVLDDFWTWFLDTYPEPDR